MKTTHPAPKLNLTREVVINFNQHKGKKPQREAIFTCCDAHSVSSTPFRQG